MILANVLFRLSVGRGPAGADHPTLAGNRATEPESAAVVDALLAVGLPTSLAEFRAAHWPAVRDAADRRRARVGR